VTPRAVTPYLLDVKRSWADSWVTRPDIEVIRATANASGQDQGSLEFSFRYGDIKQPYQTAYAARTAENLSDYWIRLRLAVGGTFQVVWVGRVVGRNHQPAGASTTPKGKQIWVAYDALYLLRKLAISHSYWVVDGDVRALGWVPSFNARDALEGIKGNRSTAKEGVSYVFGGTAIWSRQDMLEYVLERFVDEGGSTGPKWEIAGQTQPLADSTDIVEIGSSQNAGDTVRSIIPVAMGMDYRCVPTDSGFAVAPFALQADEMGFLDGLIPKNPHTVYFNAGDRANMSIDVVHSHDQKYGRIRMIGSRVVVVFSLAGSEAFGVDSSIRGSLVRKWTQELEDAYKAGVAEGRPDDRPDDVRKTDAFRPVYQAIGASATWNHHFGLASPRIDNEGRVAVSPTGGGYLGNWQNQVRKTLSWLPLIEGARYDTTPPQNGNPSGHEADFLPPAVWVYDEESARYVPAEEAGISISAAQQDWGIFLQATPNHLLGLNHFDSGSPGETDTEPRYDYENIIVTIAIETDERFQLEWKRNDWVPSDGQIDLFVPAECWYMAPGTAVGVGPDGIIRVRDSDLVIRSDADALATAMAGAIMRYGRARVRGEIEVAGLLPYQDLLGTILTVIDNGTDVQNINGPVTSVGWQFGDRPRTTLRAGFAV